MRLLTPPLVQVSDAPVGLIEIKIRDSNGARILFLQASASDLDAELVDALKAWQGRHSHRSLTLVPPSVSLVS